MGKGLEKDRDDLVIISTSPFPASPPKATGSFPESSGDGVSIEVPDLPFSF